MKIDNRRCLADPNNILVALEVLSVPVDYSLITCLLTLLLRNQIYSYIRCDVWLAR